MGRLFLGLEKQYGHMAEVIMCQEEPYLPHSSKSSAVLQAMHFCHFPTQVTITKLLTDLIHSLIQEKTSTTKKIIAAVKLLRCLMREG